MMDYNALLDLATDLGYRLAMCGAETFRVEETMNLVLAAYGVESEAFVIPNCLHLSIETDIGKPVTRMRRIGHHGNDLDAVELYSSLSRKLCSETPDPKVGLQWLEETDKNRVTFLRTTMYNGYFIGSMGFCILFGGTAMDSICAGLCGLMIGLVEDYFGSLKANHFFKTIISSCIMAIAAYGMGTAGIADNPDFVIIGALMLLVPGLLFTNAMRDIIYGDINSGTNRVVQVFLIAAAIALGTATAWNISETIWGAPTPAVDAGYSFYIHAIACFVGCFGFTCIFNIHGFGSIISASGGLLAWMVYALATRYGSADINAYFYAAIFASFYSEIMARIRKCPALTYLVISIFPLIPGAGVYYTMTHAVRGDMESFSSQGTNTIAIAGIIAVGILMISTSVRVIQEWKKQNKKASG